MFINIDAFLTRPWYIARRHPQTPKQILTQKNLCESLAYNKITAMRASGQSSTIATVSSDAGTGHLPHWMIHDRFHQSPSNFHASDSRLRVQHRLGESSKVYASMIHRLNKLHYSVAGQITDLVRRGNIARWCCSRIMPAHIMTVLLNILWFLAITRPIL